VPESSTDSPKSKVRFGFNAKSREAEAVASQYAAEQVTRINKETKIALKRVISDSIRDGVPPRASAKLIREMVGLNRPQGIALRRYVRKLTKAGYTTAAKEKAGIKLKNKMIRRRAITIARTEVIDSLTAGVELAWGQAQDQGLLGNNAKKEWMTTPFGACTICQALDGQQVLLSKRFSSSTVGALDRPTAHPNCRCGIAPVPGIGGAVAPPPAVQATGAPASTMARMAVSADGDLLKGSDARKAILKYADDPDSPYRKRVSKIKKDYDEVSNKLGNELLELQTEREFINVEINELRARERLLAKEAPSSKERLELNNLLREKHKESEEIYKRIAVFFDNDDHVKIKRLAKELREVEDTLPNEILEKFIYNKTRNTGVDIDSSPSFPQKVQTKKLKAQKKALDEGLDAWRRMTDDGLYGSILEGDYLALTAEKGAAKVIAQKGAAKVKVLREKERAFARSNKDRDYEVHLRLADTTRSGKSTTVHEMTHTVEYGNPDVLAEAIQWRDLKTKGDIRKLLSDLTGNPEYKKYEVAYDNNWVTVKNPDGIGEVYTGKVYELERMEMIKAEIHGTGKANKVFTERDGWQGSTEVSTMGMEQLYENPVRFAKRQPELFDFVYERIVKRKYTHDTSKWSLQGSKKFKWTTWSDPKSNTSALTSMRDQPMRYYALDE